MVEDGILLKNMVYLKQNLRKDFIIRTAQQSDVVELKDLFQDNVLMINGRDNSPVEVEDWASCGNNLSNIGEMI